MHGESLWGFEEVQDHAAAATYVAAAADDADHPFDSVIGTTGGTDLMVLAWDPKRFSLTSSTELDAMNLGGRVRAPLVGEMHDLEDGLDFLFVVNHLWRTDADLRLQQAQMLNAWGQKQTLPILMVGDYNFDWSVTDGENDHDAGYDALVASGVFRWIAPDKLLKTECAATYNSVLDFDFVGGSATTWTGTATILEQDNVYCNPSEERSDHRPVLATIQP